MSMLKSLNQRMIQYIDTLWLSGDVMCSQWFFGAIQTQILMWPMFSCSAECWGKMFKSEQLYCLVGRTPPGPNSAGLQGTLGAAHLCKCFLNWTPVWQTQRLSTIPDVRYASSFLMAVHRTRRPNGRGSDGFPVALWLEILIKCLNDFPVLSFEPYSLYWGKAKPRWVLWRSALKSFAGFCLWRIHTAGIFPYHSSLSVYSLSLSLSLSLCVCVCVCV